LVALDLTLVRALADRVLTPAGLESVVPALTLEAQELVVQALTLADLDRTLEEVDLELEALVRILVAVVTPEEVALELEAPVRTLVVADTPEVGDQALEDLALTLEEVVQAVADSTLTPATGVRSA
jgi:hypothetical protein